MAVLVWSPALKCDKDLLERIQHRASRLIPSLRILNYEERLMTFGLKTISDRMQREDMIQMFKIFRGIDLVEINIISTK